MIRRIDDKSKRQKFVNEVGFFNGYTRSIDAALVKRTRSIEVLTNHCVDLDIRRSTGGQRAMLPKFVACRATF